MSRTLALLTAIGSALWLSAAAALGLGEIDVQSRLNQRFTATIPLAAASAEELEGLTVKLASNADFDRAGIERAEFLNTLVFTVKLDGAPRIEVASSQIAREPFVSFLLEIQGKAARMQREYTVLLDPPNLPQAAPQPAAAPPAPAAASPPPVLTPRATSDFYETADESTRRGSSAPADTAPVAESAPSTEAAVPPTPSPTPTSSDPATGTAGTYGPVQAGETFWSIATKLRPGARVSMDQMLLAIFTANPSAFDGGSINGLHKGAVLKVPAPQDLTAADAATAKARVAELRGLPPPAPKPPKAARMAPPVEPAASPASAPEPAALPPAEKKTELTPAPAPAPAPAPKAEPAPEPVPPPRPAAVEPVAPPPPPAATPNPQPAPAAATTPPPSSEPAPSAASTTTTPEATAPAETPAAPPAQTAPAEPASTTPAAVLPEAEPDSDGMLPKLLMLVAILAVLGGLAFGAMKLIKRRKEATAAAPAPAAAPPRAARNKPAPPPPAMPPPTAADSMPPAGHKPTASEQMAKLENTMGAAAATAAGTQQLKTQQFKTQQLSTQQIEPAAAQLPTFDATQIMDADTEAAAARTAIESGNVDFDVTGQFATETVQINLDANDPISEAEFHLAYGLYDEAALLLKQAVDKAPARKELRVKLAETYFAAGKPAEFESTAEALKPMLSPAEWQKIAIMGQQLCPNAALFSGDAGAIAAADVDLAFDEPSAPPPSLSPSPSAATPSKMAVPVTSLELPAMHPDKQDSGVLDFKLESLELPSLDEPTIAAPKFDAGDALEFDLGEFDLSKSADVTPANMAAAANSMPTASPAVPRPAPAPAPANLELADIKLDDFDVGDMPADSTTISGGDEAGTKLDLARAYFDMGDNDMAKSLLGEVMQQGSADQKKEAQALIGKLA